MPDSQRNIANHYENESDADFDDDDLAEHENG